MGIKVSYKSIVLLLASSFLGFTSMSQNPFGSGNLALIVSSSNTLNNTTASVVEINKNTSGQAAIQTIAIPGTGSGAIRVSGSATSTLYASNSNDGSLLCFTGHNVDGNTSVNANTLNPRAVVTVNNSGNVAIQTTYTGISGQQTRCATTLNNSSWYIGDQSGIYTNGATSASPAVNARSVKAFGGVVYVNTSTSPYVGTLANPSGSSISYLPFAVSPSAQPTDIFLISSGTNGNSYDVLYTINSTSATAGTIAKYSLVSGQWVSNGTQTTTFGGFSILGESNSGSANLYIATGNGATSANAVIKLLDASGYNAALNITLTNNITLFTTTAGTTIKGIAYAPTVNSSPTLSFTGALGTFSTIYGTASSAQNLIVSGVNLTSGIVVSAPMGYEVSLDNNVYTNSVNITQASGIASAILYIRMAKDATVEGSYNSQNITLNSTGALTKNITTTSTGNNVSPKTVAITGISIGNKAYDASTTATIIGSPQYAGLENNETFSVTGTPVANFNNTLAEENKNVVIAGYLSPSSNYLINQPTGLTANITPKELTLTGISIQNKVFDGTTSATIIGTPQLVGVLNTDQVSIEGTPLAQFSSASIADNVPVIVTGYTISGSSVGNYSITQPVGLTANITATALQNQSITFNSLSSVVYGDNDFSISATASSGLPVTFSSSNPLVATVSGNVITILKTGATTITAAQGGDATFNPANPVAHVLIVNQKSLSITGITVYNKTYDGTVNVNFTGGTLNGIVGSDNVVLGGNISFTDAAVGTSKNVSSNLTLSGDASTNYSLVQPSGLTGDIIPKNLTINGVSASNKLFDGTTNCSIIGTPELIGVLTADLADVSLVGNITGTFATSSIGNNISIVLSGLSLTGNASSNYTLIYPSLTANITEPPTVLTTGDIAIVGYNTSGAPDNIAIVVLKTLTSNTTFLINDNELATPLSTSFTDFSEGEAMFTVKSGQTIQAGTVISLPWGGAAVSTEKYDWSTTSGFGLSNNNEELYIYNAATITSTTPTDFIYYAKIGSAAGAIPSALTIGNTAISPSGTALRYSTSGGLYTSCKSELLNVIGNTTTNWNTTGATTLSNSDWTFTVLPTCPIPVNLSVNAASASEVDATLITVTLTAASAVSVDETVSVAVGGAGITSGDYNLSNTIITIPAGLTSGSVTISIQDDNLSEGTETATLTVSNPSIGLILGATITQDIIVTDNDLASIVLTPTSGGNTVTEGGATDIYSVTLSSLPTSDVIITGTPNSQLGISPSSLTFTSSNWNSPQTVNISAVDDNVVEGLHSGSVSYSVTSSDLSFNGISVTPLTVTITDNDLPHTLAFAKADTTIAEHGGIVKVWLKVTTAGNAPGTVDLSFSSASNATNGSDFTIASTTLSLPANAALNQLIGFDITLNNDADAESDEYLICQLTNANGIAITTSGVKQHTMYIRDNDSPVPTASSTFTLTQLSSYSNGAAGTNSAEISAYCSVSKRLFIANSIANRLDILNYTNPSSPTLIRSINLANAPFSGSINSLYASNGKVALALEGLVDKQANGKVVFVDTAGAYISEVQVGAMPDMVVFNHAGTKVLTANEGEPNAAYTNDPEGSVSIIDISAGVASPSVTTLGFSSYNSQVATLKAQGIRIFGLNASVAQDFEPEYITISPNDSTAWVTLQENNALAEINLFTNTITKLIPLGYKDHSLTENTIDASDNSFSTNFSTFPVKGMYLPDAIAHYSVNGVNYLVTANEGDSRAYSGFSEESRISGLTLDATAYPNAAEWKNTSLLGRLNATNKTGDTDGDGDIDQIHVYGSRSFSIWNPAAANPLVYDSKNELEKITFNHPTYGSFFNMSNSVGTSALKNRSDDKGPEPEGVAIGILGIKTYAFIVLERIGGVMVYDISNPTAPQYVTYINNRQASTGDRGAEGIIFIDAANSPNGLPLVVVSNEVSSTVTAYQINCLIQNPTISSVSNTFCPGSSTSLSVSGISNPASYSWSNGATSSTITTGDFGSYSVSVTDVNGCTYSTPAKVLANCDKPDLNNNGITDVDDFLLFVPQFGLLCTGCTSDFNHDGVVNVDDFLLFAPRFSQTCSCAP